jgi:integrative and conjugative element protein (TIGR02256 family)
LLFGKRDDALRVIWVDDAIGPPPDSVCSPEKFICGTKGTQAANKSRKEQSRGSVEFVGMWHTHPEDLPLPSETDLSGMAQILTSGEAPPLKSLLLIVGWERHGILLGTSVFSRRIFVGGKGVVTVAANHFPGLKA